MPVNETKYDLEFNLKVSKNIVGKKVYLFFGIVILACLAAGAICLSLELLQPSEEGVDLSTPITCFVSAAVLIVVAAIWNPLLRKTTRKTMQGKESLNTFSFSEEGFSITSATNDGTTSSAQVGYGALTEVKEYRDMWLLYQNKATVFAVSKDGMKEGGAEELTALLMRQTGYKYKTCFKRR